MERKRRTHGAGIKETEIDPISHGLCLKTQSDITSNLSLYLKILQYIVDAGMIVSVKLMSLFEKYRIKVPKDEAFLPEGATVRDLATQIGLPLEYLRIITVNGKQETMDCVLAEGDVIYFFPPAIGGG